MYTAILQHISLLYLTAIIVEHFNDTLRTLRQAGKLAVVNEVSGKILPTDSGQNVEAFYYLVLASPCCSGGPPRAYAVESRIASQSKSVKLWAVNAK